MVNFKSFDHIVNVIVLISALSVANSDLYRALCGLALEGKAHYIVATAKLLYGQTVTGFRGLNSSSAAGGVTHQVVTHRLTLTAYVVFAYFINPLPASGALM